MWLARPSAEHDPETSGHDGEDYGYQLNVMVPPEWFVGGPWKQVCSGKERLSVEVFARTARGFLVRFARTKACELDSREPLGADPIEFAPRSRTELRAQLRRFKQLEPNQRRVRLEVHDVGMKHGELIALADEVVGNGYPDIILGPGVVESATAASNDPGSQ